MKSVALATVASLVVVGSAWAGPGQAKGKGAGKAADREESRQQSALQAFKTADADNNGFLSESEFPNAMRALREARSSRQGQRGQRDGASEKGQGKGAGKAQGKGAGKGQGKGAGKSQRRGAGKASQKGAGGRGNRPNPDADNDGQVSKDEFMQFVDSMRERFRNREDAQRPRGAGGQGRGASKKGKSADN
ncbi:EF hand [Planctomycetes bacterium Pan216]|uniref:EF hand n=1 Tax=Kolteria novifilia TaxID=2527975 RepID=A0A518B0Y4_9BACT|nr:EF hand [Planctomycetes bacterium Pan216]